MHKDEDREFRAVGLGEQRWGGQRLRLAVG
jgi:hypothetical protein